MNKKEIISELQKIVGKDFATDSEENLYIYSQDPGASIPRSVDFVVLPETVEQVQEIVKLANREKIPIVPMGGGLTLSGLTIPVKGGIVMDMKRMNRCSSFCYYYWKCFYYWLWLFITKIWRSRPNGKWD
ncbi:MAG: FAD-binding oxidoreductase [Promethearchaeota archaeon]